MKACGASGKTIISRNKIFGNKCFGVKLCHEEGGGAILITGNSIHRNGQSGITMTSSLGSVENNIIGHHDHSGTHVCSDARAFIASNRIHDCLGGITICKGAQARLQGNALWGNVIGIDLPSTSGVNGTGNLFSCNGYGVQIDARSPTPSAATFGPGNVFTSSLKADFVVRAKDGEGGAVAPPPPESVACAYCSAEVTASRLRCSGCAKFGAIYAPCYCGAACQKAHWPAHRAECRRAEGRQRAREAAFGAAADALLVFESCGGDDADPCDARLALLEGGRHHGGEGGLAHAHHHDSHPH